MSINVGIQKQTNFAMRQLKKMESQKRNIECIAIYDFFKGRKGYTQKEK